MIGCCGIDLGEFKILDVLLQLSGNAKRPKASLQLSAYERALDFSSTLLKPPPSIF